MHARVGALRRFLLTALPKTALSRATGFVTRRRLPRGARARVYGWFARRYGVRLDEVDRELHEFASLAEFFARPLRAGARPVDPRSALVWPCDGRIVTSGPLEGAAIQQVKGQDYGVAELVGDETLARSLAGGSQATIYLAPGDYHRVHAPFAGRLLATRRFPGALFPVNPPAVRSIARLFARNERVAFAFGLADGRAATVVMVAALNVGDIHASAPAGSELSKGQELGRFGFGSTVVALVGPGGAQFRELAPETHVRQGDAAS
jgi:phosphatidylserine decarboxylase